jgi:hypothetical protein
MTTIRKMKGQQKVIGRFTGLRNGVNRVHHHCFLVAPDFGVVMMPSTAMNGLENRGQELEN